VFAAKFITERVEGLPRQEVDVRSVNITETITSNMPLQRAMETYTDMIKSEEFVVDLTPADYESGDTVEQVKADQARALQKVLSKPTSAPSEMPGGGATKREPRTSGSKLLAAAKESQARRERRGK
jgi:hypothetical protein